MRHDVIDNLTFRVGKADDVAPLLTKYGDDHFTEGGFAKFSTFDLERAIREMTRQVERDDTPFILAESRWRVRRLDELDDDACLHRRADRGSVDDLRAAGVSRGRGRPKADLVSPWTSPRRKARAPSSPPSRRRRTAGKRFVICFARSALTRWAAPFRRALMSGSQPTNNAAVDFEKQQAAEADAKEAQRQQRLTQGQQAIDQIFNGSPVMGPKSFNWSTFSPPSLSPAAVAAQYSGGAAPTADPGNVPAGYTAVQVAPRATGGATGGASAPTSRYTTAGQPGTSAQVNSQLSGGGAGRLALLRLRRCGRSRTRAARSTTRAIR